MSVLQMRTTANQVHHAVVECTQTRHNNSGHQPVASSPREIFLLNLSSWIKCLPTSSFEEDDSAASAHATEESRPGEESVGKLISPPPQSADAPQPKRKPASPSKVRLPIVSAQPQAPRGSQQPKKSVWQRPAPSPPPCARRTPISGGSPPSSLARNTRTALSPSQRARNDEKRLKRMAERRGTGRPGPGDYNPRKPAVGAVDSDSPSASFRSKTAAAGLDLHCRDFVTAGCEAGPGAYDPNDGRDLASQRSSFNRSNRAGGGTFGSVAPRQLDIEIMGKDTPSPSAYDPDRSHASTGHTISRPGIRGPIGATGKDSGLSASFRSISPQRLPAPQQDQPGPAQYDPKLSLTLPSATGDHNVAKVGRDSRYVMDYLATGGAGTTGADIGPGTYESSLNGSMAHDMSKSAERMTKSHPGFGVGSPQQHELPFEREACEHKDMPGPGAHETSSSHATNGTSYGYASRPNGNGHTSSFATQTKRMKEWQEVRHVGDPGAYYPESGNLASETNSSFNCNNRVGAGAFGTQSVRELPKQSLGSDSPGPGAYRMVDDSAYISPEGKPLTAHESGVARQASESQLSSGFASKSAQRPPEWHRELPGPSDYHPSDSLTQPSDVSGNHPISKTGRTSRYSGDFFIEPGRAENGPGVGPATYDPKMLKDGHHTTIAELIESNLSRGGESGASFLSDTVRNVFTWFIPDELGATVRY
jgi:hypothetical protein